MNRKEMRSNGAVCMLVHMWHHTHTTDQWSVMMTQEVSPYKRDLWPGGWGGGAGGSQSALAFSTQVRPEHHTSYPLMFCLFLQEVFVVTVVKMLTLPPSVCMSVWNWENDCISILMHVKSMWQRVRHIESLTVRSDNSTWWFCGLGRMNSHNGKCIICKLLEPGIIWAKHVERVFVAGKRV